MIKAIHIEDEPNNRILLKGLLKELFKDKIEITNYADNVNDAYKIITNESPDLVFLDIELKEGNSFELLEKIYAAHKINFEVIFLTAYNDYAIKAFKYNALDYLLKPISKKELQIATEKAIKKIEQQQFPNNNIASLLQQLNDNIANKKIPINVADGLEFVYINEISKIEAKGYICVIFLRNGKKINATKSLKDIEELLPENIFIRVHNSWLINSQYIKKYYKGKSGYIEMEDGSTVPVSVRKKGGLLDY